MLIEISNKILMICFFLSCLNTLRHGYYFIQAYLLYLSPNEETPVKYRLSNTSLILLGISIAYILSSLFTGITLK
jgi:hypothetical protein